ncbi:MAG: ABC transporter ATP-binding protein [bacterium]|nr:ABC transporter ATP-binding protein [bacterium]
MIQVDHLSKIYRVHKKEEGLKASIKSLFHRKYTSIEAVKDISFSIEQGELVGFIGPNGAGKTTTLKMLSGLLFPTSGKAEVLGFTPHQRKDSYLKQISLMMGQRSQLWFDLPAIETFSLNRDIYEVEETQYRTVLNELTELLDVKDVLNQQVRNLSLGQRMKCEFIAGLLHNPKILFLDEPTIGLDIAMQKNVREFIKTYNKKYNATVILTSHYMDDVKEICKRIIMIDHGSIIFDGSMSEMIKEYANHKMLKPIFNAPVTRHELEKIGEVVEFEYPKALIHVPREQTSKKAAELLEKFDVEDIEIAEPELEEIVRVVFEKKKKI